MFCMIVGLYTGIRIGHKICKHTQTLAELPSHAHFMRSLKIWEKITLNEKTRQV
jgi:hypothetical protein